MFSSEQGRGAIMGRRTWLKPDELRLLPAGPGSSGGGRIGRCSGFGLRHGRGGLPQGTVDYGEINRDLAIKFRGIGALRKFETVTFAAVTVALRRGLGLAGRMSLFLGLAGLKYEVPKPRKTQKFMAKAW